MRPTSKFIQMLTTMIITKAGINMKTAMTTTSVTTLFTLIAAISLSGCNSIATLHDSSATACEQGIKSLNQNLSAKTHSIHQANLSRANSLLVAAKVQLQFAEYPGCLEKVKRAQDYLTGQQAAIISRL